MSTIEEYRTNAQDCLRIASNQNESDRPLWVTLAQSWLRLAEHVDRLSEAKSARPEDPSSADGSGEDDSSNVIALRR
ncbi:MAG: hypothetical protein QOG83_1403 [Alphaproteobacteria bacterium]|nr:hypothetical protein [Alphaproteobacteria bacterium]